MYLFECTFNLNEFFVRSRGINVLPQMSLYSLHVIPSTHHIADIYLCSELQCNPLEYEAPHSALCLGGGALNGGAFFILQCHTTGPFRGPSILSGVGCDPICITYQYPGSGRYPETPDRRFF